MSLGMFSSFVVVLVESGDDGEEGVRNGVVFSWGGNDYGILGLGDMEDRPTPHQVTGIHRFDLISSHLSHNLPSPLSV